MSEIAEEQEQEAPSSRSGRARVVIALTVGLVAGAAGGSLIVGPVIADPAGGEEAAYAVPAGPDLEAACEALFAEWEVEMRPPPPAAVFSIENLVLNPAQSGGTRFVMASVGFGMRDTAAYDHIVQREAEIRDVVIRVIGSKTVSELSDVPSRNRMKDEMRQEVARLVGQRGLIDIYFPQFVIQ